MSLCILEGFESYGSATGADLIEELSQKWGTYNMSNDWAELVDGHLFGKALRWASDETSGGLIFPLQSSGTFVVGFAWKPGSPASYINEVILQILGGTTIQGVLELMPTGHIIYNRGPSTVLGTTSEALPMGTWTYIELKVYIANSIGTVDIHFNGVSVMSLTGVDTMPSTRATTSEVQLHCVRYYAWDNIYMCNDDGGPPSMLGPIAIEQLDPTGDDTHNWTPSTGSTGYEVVDNPEIEDTTYVSSSTISTVELWSYSNLSEIDGGIIGVQQHTRAGTDAVGARELDILCESSTTTDSTPLGLGTDTGFDVLEVIYEEDPHTSSAWTVSNLNAANFGIEVGD